MSAKRHVAKLIAAVALVMLAIILIMVGTYAWFVASANPDIGGMQLNVGASNTIKIAADQTQTDENGNVVHYPGAFASSLSFADKSTYQSLMRNMQALIPVSTSDGLHWFAPVYDKLSNGGAITGYTVDTTLTQANLTGENDDTTHGHYVYMDFWLVAPDEDYTIRVSTSPARERETDAGSFVLAIPRIHVDIPESDDEDPTFSMTVERMQAEASLRVGFLVNEDEYPDAARLFAGSEDYDIFHGSYQEKGEALSEAYASDFTIYEPNADLHPKNETLEGKYCITRPLIGTDGTTADISAIVTPQKKSDWTTDNVTDEEYPSRLEEQLRAAVQYARNNGLLDWIEYRDDPEIMLAMAAVAADQMTNYLMGDYLQWQLAGVVNSGMFASRTFYTGESDASEPIDMASVGDGAVTEDVSIVTLRAGEPQRVRMYIWLEGQDIDCVPDGSVRNLVLNIELAGASVSGDP